MSSSMDNKVVLITGASSGIGAGAAIHFAKKGCRVAIGGRNMEKLESVAQQCRDTGAKPDNVLIVAGDVTKEEEIKKVVNQTLEKFGQIDVLVNSAGVLNEASIQNCDIAKYDYLMNVNVRGVVLVCKEVVPHLKKTKGNIVNVSSITGLRPMEDALFYSMSKAALDQFTRICATELAPKGVRVNSVNPGLIETDLHSSAGYDEARYEKYLADGRLLHPLGRNGKVEEVADGIYFLASSESSFITGVTLAIDGGRVCVTPRYVSCSRHDEA